MLELVLGKKQTLYSHVICVCNEVLSYFYFNHVFLLQSCLDFRSFTWITFLHLKNTLILQKFLTCKNTLILQKLEEDKT